ncbi:hypothetical protein [Silvibacterium dinghuense]|uniref:Uncharacterized protein n=1 Tax=Silvibacterium dinghuense TaxID=1560006 RepID=A0A4Q1SGI2_9BACT|nr:hypothetical protein [Silvibacterium dinghuense]RXS96469.1 hypothetical protein ESZ00_00455 [Silvibacterium dinghuense]GGG91007.1 hypothetical protein GCM10011586_01960 [Silvibacterium dinghuense]
MSVGSETLSELDRTMAPRFPRAGRIFLLICIPIVFAAIYYAPVLMSLGWHIMHGQAVDYRGLRVSVPWGWTADLSAVKEDYPANPQGVTLEKPPKTLNIEARGPELMYINLLLPDAHSTSTQQAAQWEELFRESHPASDFSLAVPANLPATAQCLQATPRQAQDGLHAGAAIACVSEKDGWLANYAGSQRNVPLFFQVLDGLKPSH